MTSSDFQTNIKTLDQRMRDLLDQEIIEAARVALEHEKPHQKSTIESKHTLSPDTVNTVGGKGEAINTPGAAVVDPYEKTLMQFKSRVIDIMAKALKVPESALDVTENIANYGVDSIFITEVMAQISQHLGLPLAPTIFFEAKNIKQLSELLSEQYRDHIIAGSDNDSQSDDECTMSQTSVKDKSVLASTSTDTYVVETGHRANHETIENHPENNPALFWLQRNRQAKLNANKREAKKTIAEVNISSGTQVKNNQANTAVAIIGMEGVFPQSPSLDVFARNLAEGRDCISEIPSDRWDWRSIYGDSEKGANTKVKYGGFIDGVDQFDPMFFGISPKEAELMDPQHRLYMQTVWRLIEGAGYAPSSLSGKKVANFLGINLQDYTQMVNTLEEKEAQQIMGLGHIFCPNRLSFLLGVHGPSQVIDTACSSSLVAIHRAVLSIQHEGCELAIAGGANLLLSPTMHIMFSKAGMICEDGRCKAFSQDANGYVRSDGVGAVLLKPLSQAERDGDQILARICGSGENHGGTASSLTAPNPGAQAALIKSVWRSSGVDPMTLDFIECHGTGTALGDPIEINGLKAAFKETHNAPVTTHFCGLGSVKSNIGHTETAAGVAGLIKVLLSFKYKTLYKTLHAETINPLIDLTNTPFYIVQESRHWVARTIDGIEQPRRAAVSSFGAGGSNAHIVVEEYLAPLAAEKTFQATPSQSSYVLVLSAKSAQALKQKIIDLHAYIVANEANVNIADICYTLQLGRDSYSQRLAFPVDSVSSLLHILAALKDSEIYAPWFEKRYKATEAIPSDIPPYVVFRGSVVGGGRAQQYATRGTQEFIADIKAGRYHAVLNAWVEGATIDWQMLYQEQPAKRILLPTYPFSKKAYWLPGKRGSHALVSLGSDSANRPHPMLHKRENGTGFSSRFSGREVFFVDHQLHNRGVMPGVAYLEMVVSGLIENTSAKRAFHTPVELTQVVWIRPFTPSLICEDLHLHFGSTKNGIQTFEIYTWVDDQKSTYCQGRAGLLASTPADKPVVDLKQLKDQCQNIGLSPEKHYRAFSDMGIEYGESHRCITRVLSGHDRAGRPMVLAQLHSQIEEDSAFILPPGITDAVLQASLSLSLLGADTREVKPALPFTLDKLQVYKVCREMAWVHIRFAENSQPGDDILRLDYDLMNENGELYSCLRGFSSRVIPSFKSDAPAKNQIVTLYKSWLYEPPLNATDTVSIDEDTHYHVLLCNLPSPLSISEIHTLRPDVVGTLHQLTHIEKDLEHKFEFYCCELLSLVQDIVATKHNHKISIQCLVHSDNEVSIFSALAAMFKSAVREYRHLSAQFILCNLSLDGTRADIETIRQVARENHRQSDSGYREFRYCKGEREAAYWMPVESGVLPVVPPRWRDGGIYLVSGGSGMLAQLIARHIVAASPSATVVLAGRGKTRTVTAGIVYRQVDITHRHQVASLIENITAQYGRLDGVIHCAGCIKDGHLSNKTTPELREVLAPKVRGFEALDSACANISLDFFLLFSSISAVLGNIGQTDYATANAYLDVAAKVRNIAVAQGMRAGTTLSISWGIWQNGGMTLAPEDRRLMEENTGLSAFDNEQGLQLLDRCIAYCQQKNQQTTRQSLNQVVVLSGESDKIKQTLFPHLVKEEPVQTVNSAAIFAQKISSIDRSNNTPSHALSADLKRGATANLNIDGEELSSRLETDLAQLISAQLKVELDDIDNDIDFTDYGFESITFSEFTVTLNERYQLALSPTIFFEYPNIACFAQFLVDEHSADLADFFGFNIAGETPQLNAATSGSEHITSTVAEPMAVDVPTSGVSSALPGNTTYDDRINRSTGDLNREPTAIVGMSGCFPMAENIDAFWQNLASGKDCISEVPLARWDWREIYGDPKVEHNKTNIKWGGFIEGVESFDAYFFSIPPAEAEQIDPQQRLIMTYVWQAIEDAGYAAKDLAGSATGLFIATAGTGYSDLLTKANTRIEGYSSTGMVASVGPNRMSYYLDFHGPSEPVETACSSSLVAIHRAIRSMSDGECTSALVGGVNTMLSADGYISFSKAGMLCEDGRCKTFSENANGYVRGEGVGMLLLKPLSAAERDGDNIYAVIRGSAVNHGGRASSLTAPNPKAQVDLLLAAYENAGVDPASITYIEAHGTGTPLGDPIEFESLHSVFDEAISNSSTFHPGCGLGSVKSNIGHLELAAGIAGVIKVLLQLKHQTIARSLHCEEPNPLINIEDSPFYIPQQSRPWETAKDAQGVDLPRRAGVSSFGFGGVNAHIVLEEYPLIERALVELNETQRALLEVNSRQPLLCLLSAKKLPQLLEKTRALRAYLANIDDTELTLRDLMYTLQVGRDSMNYRLAVLAMGKADLMETLANVLDSCNAIEQESPKAQVNTFLKIKIDRVFTGYAIENKDILSMFINDKDIDHAILSWCEKGKYSKLLNLWCKGFEVDWHSLYNARLAAGIPPRRQHLPTYPFAKDVHWVNTGSVDIENHRGPNPMATAALHPLVHSNTSTVYQQSFQSEFNGQEWFFADHKVNSNGVLSGVAYLEILHYCATASLAIARPTPLRLRQVTWVQPLMGIAVDGHSPKVFIVLDTGMTSYAQQDSFGFKISSQSSVHVQAQVERLNETGGALDLTALKKGLSHCHYTPEQHYRVFSKMGIDYGGRHRSLSAVYCGPGESGDPIVLAHIELAQNLPLEPYIVHPGIVDCALQASLSLLLDDEALTRILDAEKTKPEKRLQGDIALPFSLEEVDIFKPCQSIMWAVLSRQKVGISDNKLTVTLCDDAGIVCIRLKNIRFRSMSLDTQPFSRPTSWIAESRSDEMQAGETSITEKSAQRNTVPDQAEDKLVLSAANDSVADTLCRILSETLKIKAEDIAAELGFNEYGLDSVTLTSFANAINHHYDLGLTPAVFFDHPSIEELSVHLVDEYGLEQSREALQGSRESVPVVTLEQQAPPPLTPPLSWRQNRLDSEQSAIAIVGISGSFPMAQDVDQFWRNLVGGRDCISEIPKSRWDWRSIYGDPRDSGEKTDIKWGGFMPGVELFDPLFFGISPLEAELMDPQQRLLMLHVWKALEDSGYTAKRIAGSRTALYIGTASSGYSDLLKQADIHTQDYSATGSVSSIGPNRMSYFLNIHGPSQPIETACSSSLVALHYGVTALNNNHCELAIVGGVNTMITPQGHISFSKAGMLSKDGRCKTFARAANGYARGEGVAIVVLKPLDKAERDRDFIYGLVRGSGENHGGRANSLTAPNPKAQSALLQEVYQRAGVPPSSVNYIEAHGTGTALGDPIEINALKSSFKALSAYFNEAPMQSYCGIGTVKSHIGHLELAAGIASVVKVLLQLQHKTLPKTLHLEEPNPFIELADSPFYIVDKNRRWEALKAADGSLLPRRAGISSFGFGGVNAHVIIEEYTGTQQPANTVNTEQPMPQAIVISAKTAQQRAQSITQLSDWIKKHKLDDRHLADMAFTLKTARDEMPWRFAVIVHSMAELQALLERAAVYKHDIKTAAIADKFDDDSIFFWGRAEEGRTDPIIFNSVDNNLQQVLSAWVAGKQVVWFADDDGRRPGKRIRLPGYPFNLRPYWLPTTKVSDSNSTYSLGEAHTQSEDHACFHIPYDGEEFFLNDHRVNGKSVLPGVMYLELALNTAARIWQQCPKSSICIEDLVWLQPIYFPLESPFQQQPKVHVQAQRALYKEDTLEFSVQSAVGDTTSPVLHAKAKLIREGNSITIDSVGKKLEVQTLLGQCQPSAKTMTEYYSQFDEMGLNYGPSHRAIEQLYLGVDQVLAKLALPEMLSVDSLHDFTLHPSIIDAALQASVGLLSSDAQNGAALPFALGKLKVWAPCKANMWAWVRYAEDSAAMDKVWRLNIDICNEDGQVCVQLENFSLRELTPSVIKKSLEQHIPKQRQLKQNTAPQSLTSREHVVAFLCYTLADTLKLPVNDIEPTVELEKYGLDSLLSVRLTEALEKLFGPLPKTLFFEYQSIDALASYFLSDDRYVALIEAQSINRREAQTSYMPPVSARGATENSSVDGDLSANHANTNQSAASTHSESRRGAAIAIIGLAGRYAGAEDIHEFWQNLKSGRDCIREIPPERWDYRQYFDADKKAIGKSYSKWGGFIDHVDCFDSSFFNISPREAQHMDPQERIFLQCAVNTLEDAGYTPERLNVVDGRTVDVGVYVGVMYEEYQLYGAEQSIKGNPLALSGHPASIANRVSYFCNFSGPSIALDTMCSSSLTTIHLACNAIRYGECHAAIAGGVNVSIHPNKYLSLSQGRFMSSNGRCQSFGNGGDGYVPGEGVGAVLLKSLEDAECDGDAIYALIIGSAINHGGKTNGYAVPNPNAQARVIENALREAEVDPRAFSYLEAHGTGTNLGDPIEIAGLSKAFNSVFNSPVGDSRPSTNNFFNNYCPIGSVKSNIGHCESAAGIAGVTKVLLQFQHHQLVPSLHSKTTNPNIDFSATPFRVQQELTHWPSIPGKSRVAGVSSFGAGGANAHLIIEEFERGTAAKVTGNALIQEGAKAFTIPLSATTRQQLQQLAKNLLRHVRTERYREDQLAHFAFTLQCGRMVFEERAAWVVDSFLQLEQQLEHFITQQPFEQVREITLDQMSLADIDTDSTMAEGHVRQPEKAQRLYLRNQTLRQQQQQLLSSGSAKQVNCVLMNLWVRGVTVDWQSFYGSRFYSAETQRLHLPGYPFAKERHWVPELVPGLKLSADNYAKPEVDNVRASSRSGLLKLEPQWRQHTLPSSDVLREDNYEKKEGERGALKRIVINMGISGDHMPVHLTEVEDLWVYDDGDIVRNYTALVEKLIAFVQKINCNDVGRLQVIIFCSENNVEAHIAAPGINALLATANLEYPSLHTQLVEWHLPGQKNPSKQHLSDSQDVLTVLDRISDCDIKHMRWYRQQAFAQYWKNAPQTAPAPPARDHITQPWQEGGVYLITGGAGGLGFIFAEEIVRQLKCATIILLGRSQLNRSRQRQLQKLRTQGAEYCIEYHAVDLLSEKKLRDCIDFTLHTHGHINGIIHSAGVLWDGRISDKAPEQIEKVLAPKVGGLVNLDRATADVQLDFFVLFSSLSGAFGNAGQVDYASANGFMDGYAVARSHYLAQGLRHGRTLSINWPLWQAGGMHLDDVALTRLRQSVGMVPMSSENGITAFRQALLSNYRQVAFIEGDFDRLEKIWPRQTDEESHTPSDTLINQITPPPIVQTHQDESQCIGDGLLPQIEYYLTTKVAELTGFARARIHTDETLERYGMDSVMALKLADLLKDDFAIDAQMIVFEYNSVAALAAYLVKHEVSALQAYFGESNFRHGATATVVSAGRSNQRVHTDTSAPTVGQVKVFAEKATEESKDIAIIGVTGRYPMADTLEDFWQNLSSGRDCISHVPIERWSLDQDELTAAQFPCKWGGFIDDVEWFDPLFFNISPNNAKYMDPNERLSLECVWNLLESSCYTRERLQREYLSKVGIFFGAMFQPFHAFESLPDSALDTSAMISLASYSAIVNRISHFFNLQGPSVAVDTMCSSGLTAVHMACESLRDGTSHIAVAGAVNLSAHPKKYRGLSALGLIASNEKSRSFSVGDGYLPSEGVGAVLLKTLTSAEADGDVIYGLIKSSHINHGGQSQAYAQPNPAAQRNLLEENFAKSAIPKESISYIECAANGSALGDAMEIDALKKVFSEEVKRTGQHFALGTVKANIGHGEAVSGIAQLTKVILQLQHRQWVPSVQVAPLNPKLNLEKGPFVLPTTLQTWDKITLKTSAGSEGESTEYPRRASINAFGAGGSNAHLIVEEYEAPISSHIFNPVSNPNDPQLFVLSAQSEKSLFGIVQQLIKYLLRIKNGNNKSILKLSDLAYTLQLGREAMSRRMAWVTSDIESIVKILEQYQNSQQHHSATYVGDIDAPEGGVQSLLTGNLSEQLVDLLIAQNNLDDMARYWVQGGRIPWQKYWRKQSTEVSFIHGLPTYAFDRQYYWLDKPDQAAIRDGNDNHRDEYDQDVSGQPVPTMEKSHIDSLREILADVLRVDERLFKEHRSLVDYGLDSLSISRLLNTLRTRFGLDLNHTQVFASPTLSALAQKLNEHLTTRSSDNSNAPNITATNFSTDTTAPVHKIRSNEHQFYLSEGQKGLWFLMQLDPYSSAYHVPMAFSCDAIDDGVLQLTISALAKMYPVLTVYVRAERDDPSQIIASTTKDKPADIRVENMIVGKDEPVSVALRAYIRQPFDFNAGPLMRVQQVITSENTAHKVLLFTFHHLVFDGISAVIFLQAFKDLYRQFSAGKTPRYSVQTLDQHQHFTSWEQTMLSSKEGRAHADYWREQLSEPLPHVDFIRDVRICEHDDTDETVDVKKPAVACYTFDINERLSNHARAFAKDRQVNLSSLFLTVFKLFLFHYTQQKEFIIAMPCTVRPEKLFETQVAYRVNMLPIRTRLNPSQSFIDYLGDVQSKILDALDHSVYPLPLMLRCLTPSPMGVHVAPFQLSYSYQNFIRPVAESEDTEDALALTSIPDVIQQGDEELGLEVFAHEITFSVNIHFNSQLFSGASVKNISEYFSTVLDAVLLQPELALADFSLQSEVQKLESLQLWQGDRHAPRIDSPTVSAGLVHRRIETWARRMPQKCALICAEDKIKQGLSYTQLNSAANRLARFLLAGQGGLVKRETQLKVGVCLASSKDCILALLALLKIGAVYVPNAADAPLTRLAFVVEDLNMEVMLCDNVTEPHLHKLKDRLSGKHLRLVNIDENAAHIAKLEASDLDITIEPDTYAYIIYTSGSTGNPKGVVVTCGTIAEHCANMVDIYRIHPEDKILNHAAQHVDAALEQILPGLMSGATIITRDQSVWSATVFVRKALAYRFSVVDIPPAYFKALLQEWLNDGIRLPESICLVICGGERLPIAALTLWEKIKTPNVRLFNAYGPTETTVTSLIYEVPMDGLPTYYSSVPIGRPLPNERAYILNTLGQPVAEGVVGELYLGGMGLAVGYWNRPQEEQKRFIHKSLGVDHSQRLYRTGDLARYISGSQGLIEYLGRIDQQIKIRGFRIEPHEIEIQLLRHPSIDEAAVMVDNSEEPQLVAYIASKEPVKADDTFDRIGELEQYLRESLPAYMIPKRWFFLDALPKTGSDKIDRHHLHNKDAEYKIRSINSRPGDQLKPQNDVEQQLLTIWQRVLRVSDIGTTDDFFQLGGHSILALRLMAEVEKCFGREMPLSLIISHSTITQQAYWLIQKDKANPSSLVPMNNGGHDAENAKSPPFYCVHPVGGNVLAYVELARQFSGVFYGIQSLSDDNANDLNPSIEQMAQRYIEDIYHRQANGPYHISGWSLGGVIAYEIGRQLHAAGKTVGSLTLIDSYTPEFLKHRGMDKNTPGEGGDLFLAKAFIFDLLSGARDIEESLEYDITFKTVDELFEAFIDRQNEEEGTLTNKTIPDNIEQLQAMFSLYRKNARALSLYQPKPYHGNVTLFTCLEESSNGWRELIHGDLRVNYIAADHYSILTPPHSHTLAAHLAQCVDAIGV